MQPCSFSRSIYRSRRGLSESHSSQGGCDIPPGPLPPHLVHAPMINLDPTSVGALGASRTQLRTVRVWHSFSVRETHSPHITEEEAEGQKLNNEIS